MSTTETTSAKSDVYSRVTSQIITAIEQGTGSWRMPWHTSGAYAFSPINVVSRKPYRGVNTLSLWATARTKGYEHGEWGTYQQWSEGGAQVRRGEKATTVVFWKFANDSAESEENEADHSTRSHLLFARGYSVFNASQVDGYAPKPEREASLEQRIESAERFFARVPARVIHQGNRAFYSPLEDLIMLPPFFAFFSAVDYYSTRAHETGHWTATESRCNRELGRRFGDHAYSMEELVAELTAAFVCAHLGLSTEPRPDHAQYMASWLRVLKADTRAVFTAASKAQQATDYIIRLSESAMESAA